jgi:rare lipoprotein A
VFKRPVHAGSTSIVVVCVAIDVVALLAASGCAHRTVARTPGGAASQPPAKIGTTETGIASWYGEPYNGRRAASGEIFDMEQLTAAHRSFPFQTWVEVTDLDNGKKVSVRIIDRGPFVKGRVIDLSLAAARKIEMVGPGTAHVKLKVIATPKMNSSATPVATSGGNGSR